MEFLLLVSLAGAVVLLWSRVRRLQQQVAQLEQLTDRVAAPATRAMAEPAADPGEPPLGGGPDNPFEDEQTVAHAQERSEPITQSWSPPEQNTNGNNGPETNVLQSDEDQESVERRPGFQFDFEDIFGRRLPIWAGGMTLAIAGVFLVRYSIEYGVLTPSVRVALAFIFGLILLAGAEWAFRNEARVADERVRQALAGAGLATLYAAFYLAGSQYGLVGQAAAFLGLAAVTAGAIALSFRFGLPCAILGLVGGFAAPALIGGEEANLPLLSLYLGLVTAGLTVTGNRQARPWLSIAALVFGLGWGAVLLLSGDRGVAEIMALALYFIVLGAVLPTLADARSYARPVRLGSALVASIQFALLVDQGGYAPLAWALYLLLGAALAFFAWRKPDLRETSAIAAVVSILLLAQWSAAPPATFAAVAAAIALVYAGVPLAHIWWRDAPSKVDLVQLCLVPLALAAISYFTLAEFGSDAFEPQLAVALIALAAFPLAGTWRQWRSEAMDELTVLLATGSLLAFGAVLLVTPAWAAVIVAAPIFAVLFVLLQERWVQPVRMMFWAAAGLSLMALTSTAEIGRELPLLAGLDTNAQQWRGGLRWLAALVPWLLLAWKDHSHDARIPAEAMGAVLGYGLVAQFFPDILLAWAAALGALAVWFGQKDRFAAQFALLAIAACWAALPLGGWTASGFAALAGNPMFVGDMPDPLQTITRLLPLGVGLAVIRFPMGLRSALAADTRWLAIPVGAIIAHSLFKQVFALDTVAQFVELGLAERTLWQAFLLGGAVLLVRGGGRFVPQPRAAMLLAGMALAHFIWFSGGLHNPLWARQAVGPVPIANLVLAAGLVGAATALFLRRYANAVQRPAVDALTMIITGFTALALLRQTFAGSIPIDAPMGQTEDLLRSLMGIVLALAFLYVGKLRQERSWRIGSLAFMLVAVAKVFIWDAAGLEGLLRIASFMALGFSLIGIGWIYARQLKKLSVS